MDMLYSIKRNKTIKKPAILSPSSACTISVKNIIAFSTSQKLIDSSSANVGSFVYVADIITPWHIFEVCSVEHVVTVLEWNSVGDLLLISDLNGNIQIWTQNKFLISDWIPIYSVTFPGEHILCCKFFDNGKSLLFHSEKKDCIMYVDKFQTARTKPSVRLLGGTAAEGCLILTASGLLGAFLIKKTYQNNGGLQGKTPEVLDSITHSLGLTRQFITAASISHGRGKNNGGRFCIATVNGSSNKMMIQCFSVKVKLEMNNRLSISSHSLPSFFVLDGSVKPEIMDLKLTHLKFEIFHNTESVIVVANGRNCSVIELWSLVQVISPIHKFLQVTKTEVFHNTSWKIMCSLKFDLPVVDICVTKLELFNYPFVFILFIDNSVQILGKGFKKISSSGILNGLLEDGRSCIQRRQALSLTKLDVTFMGHILVSLDNFGHMHVFKVPQWSQEQVPNQMTLISYQVLLLEYSFLCGYDASDVVLTLKPNLEMITEKLTENFSRQPPYVRQFYYVEFLTLKTNLCRRQPECDDLNNLLMLHSVLTAFKSLLRPTDLTSHDKGPADSLALVLSDSLPDVDKVLFNLDVKEFTVESITLQGLKQLIQWVADLAINILAKLPKTFNHAYRNKNIGYNISKDIVALNSIRELLVIIRIWGLLNNQCLPTFLKSTESLDILAITFRLLTRLTLNPSDPDEMLLDDCCVLPTQLLIPQLKDTTSSALLNSPICLSKTLPVFLLYGVEPEIVCIENNVDDGILHDRVISGSVNNNLPMGVNPISAAKCLRCGLLSSVNCFSKTIAMISWMQRWKNCRCGGSWK